MKRLFALLFMIAATSMCHSQVMNITYKELVKNSKELSFEIKASYPQVDFGPDALMGA